MSVLIVGYGSIGRRHARNLAALGLRHLVVHDLDEGRLRAARDEVAASTFDTLDAALETQPTLVLVCTPPASHVPVALAAAERGCHLFVEKPLTDRDDDQLDALLGIVERKRLISLVGCNLRFHHGPSTLKSILDDGVIGRPLGAALEMGQYLPDWHPHEDYRHGHSVSGTLGGGILLDAIHELDYARWFFGEVRELVAFGGKVSTLEIETEDFASILLRFASGVIAQVHLDYIQRAYSRWCRIFSEQGTAVWDIATGTVRLFSAVERQWTEYAPPPGYDVNEMYLAELRHLLRCLEGTETSRQPLAEGAAVVRIALAARESMRTGAMVVLT